MEKIEFKITGLHCKSCKTLLEGEVGSLAGVKNIKVNYQTGNCLVEFDQKQISFSQIKNKIENFDYQVNLDPKTKKSKAKKNSAKTFVLGLLLPLFLIGFLVGYFYIQKSGALAILAKLNESNLSYGLIFLIGFLASFHCIGMCGGLVITYSASAAVKEKAKKINFSWAHLQYNLGRLISYTLVGAILGGLGSFFAINQTVSGILMLVVGSFMILMAVSLFTNYKWLEKVSLKTPQFIAKFIFKQSKSNNPKTPLVIGLLTGLMPCGPLQAMQLYALGTGDWRRGALSLAFFALGTTPLMFGFGTFISYLSKNYMKKVMKISAIIVGLLALIMIGRGLANFGFNFSLPTVLESGNLKNEKNPSVPSDSYQQVKMTVTYSGYQPNVLYIKKGIPVRWVINGSGISGCTNVIQIPEYGIRQTLFRGENIINFTPDHTGEIAFSCGMQMVWGKFIVQ
ncbi:MAG: sulfite exporter TauE/SafE family protein [Candidatus Buchananbacteria bacterium]